jgi:hypothetical protein
MQETLLPNNDNTDKQVLRDKVTDMGLLGSELEDKSHCSQVRFVPDDKQHGTNMIWDVKFEAKHRRKLWQTVTEGNIQTVAANLASYLATPCLCRRTTILECGNTNNNTEDATQGWMQFIWNQGGGLPLLASCARAN